MKEITSAKNAQFSYFQSLLKSKGLKSAEHFILSGSKLVKEALSSPADLEYVLLTKSQLEQENDRSLLQPWLEQGKGILLSDSLFYELDTLGTRSPLLILKQPKIELWEPSLEVSGLQLLCPLGDPQNVGALIRTAYAFGVHSLVLLEEAAHPFLPKAVKASSGAVLKMPLFKGPSIQAIQSPVVALDLNGTPLNEWVWKGSLQLLVGEEGAGIPSSFDGDRLTLPMKNPMESLNASMAAGIAIYALTGFSTTRLGF